MSGVAINDGGIQKMWRMCMSSGVTIGDGDMKSIRTRSGVTIYNGGTKKLSGVTIDDGGI